MITTKSPQCAYIKDGECRVLLNTKSCGLTCPFHKTSAAAAQSNARSAARLRSLEPYEQLAIAERYYGGDMPWRRGGGAV